METHFKQLLKEFDKYNLTTGDNQQIILENDSVYRIDFIADVKVIEEVYENYHHLNGTGLSSSISHVEIGNIRDVRFFDDDEEVEVSLSESEFAELLLTN